MDRLAFDGLDNRCAVAGAEKFLHLPQVGFDLVMFRAHHSRGPGTCGYPASILEKRE